MLQTLYLRGMRMWYYVVVTKLAKAVYGSDFIWNINSWADNDKDICQCCYDIILSRQHRH